MTKKKKIVSKLLIFKSIVDVDIFFGKLITKLNGLRNYYDLIEYVQL